MQASSNRKAGDGQPAAGDAGRDSDEDRGDADTGPRADAGVPAAAPGGSAAAADRPLRLERWLPFRLFTVSARVADVLSGFYGPRYGLSRAAWRTMAIVANRQGISAKEICQAGGLDQFAVSRAIGQLVEFGYARRRSGRSDKRYASIALTPEGWAVFQEISALAKAIDAELTAQVTAEETAMLDGVLHKLDTASAGILARGWHALVTPGGESPGEQTPDEEARDGEPGDGEPGDGDRGDGDRGDGGA